MNDRAKELLRRGTPGLVDPVKAARMIEEIRVDQAEEFWTPDIVRGRLDEAIKLVHRTTGRFGPRQYGTAMPATLTDWADWLAQIETGELGKGNNRSRVPATAAQVSRAEEAIAWPMTYLRPWPGPLRVLNMHLVSKAYRLPFSRVCKGAGIPLATAKRARSKAFSIISQGLARDGVPVA